MGAPARATHPRGLVKAKQLKTLGLSCPMCPTGKGEGGGGSRKGHAPPRPSGRQKVFRCGGWAVVLATTSRRRRPGSPAGLLEEARELENSGFGHAEAVGAVGRASEMTALVLKVAEFALRLTAGWAVSSLWRRCRPECVVRYNRISSRHCSKLMPSRGYLSANSIRRNGGQTFHLPCSRTVHELRRCKERRSFGIPNQCAISNAAQ